MRSCKHEALVELTSTADACMVDPHRLHRLVDSLPNPSQQKPLVISCLGGRQKTFALQQLFPANDFKSRDRRPSLCKAYSDALTAHLPNPVFFLDIDPESDLPTQDIHAHCHLFETYHLRDKCANAPIDAVLLKQLVLPFTDVLCIFAEDVGGCPGVLQHLQSWALSNVEGTDERLHTRLVVVVPDDESRQVEVECEEFVTAFQDFGLNHLFPNFRIERASMLPLQNARYIPFRKLIFDAELEAARVARAERMHLFSGLHLASLFSQCLAQTAEYPRKRFSLLAASRLGVPALPHFVEGVCAILRAAHDHDIPFVVVVSLLSTSLLMQACPPSAHSKCAAADFRRRVPLTDVTDVMTVFAPVETFEALFRELLTASFDKYFMTASVLTADSAVVAPHEITQDVKIGQVLDGFVESWKLMRARGVTAVSLHKTRLESVDLRSRWGAVRSNVFCAVCITRRPEHVFKCRHAICDMCAKQFGVPRMAEEYAYVFSDCICCGAAADLLIRLKPPTAGLRILGMDGGGLRGIISLEFFRLLQRSLGSSCQVQDFFDLALGTSVGRCESEYRKPS